MDKKEAIKAIKSNYPPERYSMLREALDIAMESIEKQIELERFMDGRPSDKENHVIDATMEYIEQVENTIVERYHV